MENTTPEERRKQRLLNINQQVMAVQQVVTELVPHLVSSTKLRKKKN